MFVHARRRALVGISLLALAIPVAALTNSEAATATGGPALSVGDAAVGEGDTGSLIISVPVTLSSPASTAVTVRIGTNSGSATIADFQPSARTLKIAAGNTQAAFSVKILGDTLVEGTESFTVELVQAIGADVPRTTGTVTIWDNDEDSSNFPNLTGSSVRLAGGAISEGDSGVRSATFYATVVPAPTSDLRLRFTTSSSIDPLSGSATDPSDLDATTRTITVRPGISQARFVVRVQGDTSLEPDEAFLANVQRVGGAAATVVNANAVMTILTDDAQPNCDDNDPQTIDTYDNQSGSCQHTVINCDDNDAYTTDGWVSGPNNTITCTNVPIDIAGDGNYSPSTAVPPTYASFETNDDLDCFITTTPWAPAFVGLYPYTAAASSWIRFGTDLRTQLDSGASLNGVVLSPGEVLCVQASAAGPYVLDGSGSDLDFDGWTAVGGDCNDADASVNPGVSELLGNGIDDNCDGIIDFIP